MTQQCQSTARARSGRLPFVDTMRGIAVLTMLVWHTIEGWLSPDLAGSVTWRTLRYVGGLGAPMFVLLAGAAVALRFAADERQAIPRERTVRGLVARGLVIVLAGYTLRLQFWLLDSLAILRPESAIVWVPAGLGLAAAIAGAGKLERLGPREAAPLLGGGVVVFFGALSLVGVLAPSRLEGVLRVDVLQCIGVSLVLVGTVGHAIGAVRSPVRAVVVAVLLLLATPAVTLLLPTSAPAFLTDYVADTAATDARFPLLPWCAYAWVGLALGVLFRRAAEADRLGRVVLALALLGVGLALLTSESLPHAYRWTHELPWLVHPFRVAHRVGVVTALCAPALAIARRAGWLTTYGRASLVVYWVHLTFAFGIGSRPLSGSLDWREWLTWLIVLCLAMYAVARFRLGPFEAMRSRVVARRPLSAFRALL